MKTEQDQIQELTMYFDSHKRKSAEFKLFAGNYNSSLDAINPLIKEIIMAQYNEIDRLKKENLTLQDSNKTLINQISDNKGKKKNITVINNYSLPTGDMIVNNFH